MQITVLGDMLFSYVGWISFSKRGHYSRREFAQIPSQMEKWGLLLKERICIGSKLFPLRAASLRRKTNALQSYLPLRYIPSSLLKYNRLRDRVDVFVMKSKKKRKNQFTVLIRL